MSGSIRIVEMPDLGAVNDSSSIVGERAGSGRFSAPALKSYTADAFNVRNYGAKGDGTTDDTAAIQAAVTAAIASGGAGVYFPGGRAGYKVSAPIVINTASSLVLFSDGPGSGTILPSSLTADVFQVTVSNPNAAVVFQGLHVFFGTRATTAGVVFRFIVAGTIGSGVLNCSVINGWSIVSFEGAGDQSTFISNLEVQGAKNNAIQFLSGFAGNAMVSNCILNTDSTNGGAAILMQAGDGNSFANIQSQGFATGVNATASAGQSVLDSNFVNVGMDNETRSPTGTGWIFDGTGSGAQVTGVAMTQCWSGSNNASAGIDFKNVNNITLIGCIVVNNGHEGIYLEGSCSNVLVHGCIVSGNGQTAGTWPGITVGAGMTNFSITGNRSGTTPRVPTVTQAYGISVITGASDYYVIANNLVSGNITAGVGDGGTGTHKTVTGNV
jgi:parallel beta-helix repeat protein